MKYISVVILIALMSWTWSLATTERGFTLEEHMRVEEGVEKDIKAFIVGRYPQTTDIYCQELYTEPITAETEMVVHFRCKSEGKAAGDETITQVFEGQIQLRSNDQFKTWSEVGGQIRAPEIEYSRGVQVSAKDPFPEAPAPGSAEKAHK